MKIELIHINNQIEPIIYVSKQELKSKTYNNKIQELKNQYKTYNTIISGTQNPMNFFKNLLKNTDI